MSQQPEPIAIIGSGCRFPGEATTPNKLWSLINEPRDVSSTIGPDRFNVDGFYHKDSSHHGTSNIRHSYLLKEDCRTFDASFFSIKPVEAEAMDPQQRMLLEVVYEALEAGGQKIHKLQGSDTAVYVGAMSADYGDIGMRDLDSIPTYFSTGSHRSILSNRISWFFDWRGPCMTIDTACSSSLVALDSAVQTLRGGTSRVAVAAGANLCLGPEQYVAESKLKMLSPSGRSSMWSAEADGYARGEGIAAVVLKTLSAALEDGDHIECIVRATGVNQDGKTKGITVPSRLAQAALIQKTYSSIGLNPSDPTQRCQYFEAHGTGTPAGDPIEAGAIAKAFFGAGSKRREDILYVGSIKTIIGHTEGTAGLAGVLKASAALKHKVIPPNMHFNSLSDTVKPFYKNLRILQSGQPWPAVAPGQPRRASVNSFGFGGTNAHAILESVEEPESECATITAPFVFSSASQQSLEEQISQFARYLDENPDLNARDLWYTLSRRSIFSFRTAFTASSIAELRSALVKSLDNSEELGDQIVTRAVPKSARILGVFTGQGAQWALMGRDLIQKSSFAARRLDELTQVLAELPSSDRPSWTLKDQLFAEGTASKVNAATVSQPLCTAVQVVLVDALKTIGIKFDSVVGHSSGEIGAAYAAGLVSASDAIRIAYYRGFYAHLAAGTDGKKGVMMAVGTSYEDAQELCALEEFEGKVTVAASNSSSSQTLSGDADTMEDVKAVCEEEGKFARYLKVEVAYHSHHMVPCGEVYQEALARFNVQVRTPEEGSPCWFSSVSGGTLMDETSSELTGKYWRDNMLNTVLFDQALRAALDERGPFDLALEVGPHPALQGPASQTIQEVSSNAAPYHGVLRRGKPDLDSISDALGFIWKHLGDGAVDLEAYDALLSNAAKPRLIKGLPSYAWDHDRVFWHESRQSIAFRSRNERSHELLGARTNEHEESEFRWRNYIGPKSVPWLSGHRLQGQVVFPAAGYIAMTTEAALKLYPEIGLINIDISNMTIGRPMTFDDEATKIEILYSLSNVQTIENTVTASWRCSAALKKGSSNLSTLASGDLELTLGHPSAETLTARNEKLPALTEVDPETFYGDLGQLGYNYNGLFKGMNDTKRKLGLSNGSIVNPVVEDVEEHETLLVHPGLVDIGFQTIFMAHSAPKDGGLYALHVPNLIRKISINPVLCRKFSNKAADLPFEASAHTSPSTGIEGDVAIFSTEVSHAMIQIEGCRVVPFSVANASDDRLLFSKFEWGPVFPRIETGNSAQASTNTFQRAANHDDVTRSYLLDPKMQILASNEEVSPRHRQLLQMAATTKSHLSRQNRLRVQSYTRWKHSAPNPSGDVELDMIHRIGTELPSALDAKTEVDISSEQRNEYLESTIGESPQHSSLIQMMEQIAFLFPHLHILEIGNGSHSTTMKTINNLGTAFRSYTYTMPDEEAVQEVQGRLSNVSKRVMFKTLDLSEEAESQGFSSASYDVVLSVGGLSMFGAADADMSNVRKLLKTGGYLLVLEPTNQNSIRTTFVMNVLTKNRFVCRSPQQWMDTLSDQGFDNLQLAESHDGSTAHPYTLLAARATTQDFTVLQQPLAYNVPLKHLVVIGSESPTVQLAVAELETIIRPYCQDVTIIEKLEDFESSEIPPMCSVIALSDLGEPIFQNMSETKLENLKALLDRSRNVLWLSKGCWENEPYANMMLGLGRTARVELPHLRLQFLDLDFHSSIDATLLAEVFLRLIMSGVLDQDGHLENSLWYNEPELVVRDGELHVPRVLLDHEKNNRYNSARRPIERKINPQRNCVSTTVRNGTVQVVSDRIAAIPSPTIINVELSTLHAIRTPAGYAHFVYGTNLSTGEPTLAISQKNSSIVAVSQSWSVAVKSQASKQTIIESAMGAVLLSELKRFSHCSVLVYEPPAYLQAAVNAEPILFSHVYLMASQASHDSVIRVERFETQRSIQAKLPSGIGLFVDCVQDKSSAKVRACLPAGCVEQRLSSFFGEANILPETDVTDLLNSVVSGTNINGSGSVAAIDVAADDLDKLGPRQDALIAWSSACVSTNVKRATELVDFTADTTYLLFGLSGELGKSTCDWMVKRGARNFVLTSRNPTIDDVWMEQMQAIGANVKVVSNDITNKAAVHALIQGVRDSMPPIAGVVNGVMALVDGPFVNVTFESLEKGMKAKVQGTIILDEIFSDNSLDFYICLCSLANAVGNSGQSVYSAANNYMAATMTQRRQKGLAGSTLDIGPLLGIGYLSRLSLDQVQEHLYKSGFMFCSERDFHDMFAEAVVASPANSGSDHEILTGIRILSTEEPIKGPWFFDPRMQHFVRQPEGRDVAAGSKTKINVRSQLAKASSAAEVATIVQDAIVSQLQNMLKLSVGGAQDSAYVLEKTADELGIDSLVAVELRSWFLGELQVDIPVLKILGGASMKDLMVMAIENLPTDLVAASPEATEDKRTEQDPGAAAEAEKKRAIVRGKENILQRTTSDPATLASVLPAIRQELAHAPNRPKPSILGLSSDSITVLPAHTATLIHAETLASRLHQSRAEPVPRVASSSPQHARLKSSTSSLESDAARDSDGSSPSRTPYQTPYTPPLELDPDEGFFDKTKMTASAQAPPARSPLRSVSPVKVTVTAGRFDVSPQTASLQVIAERLPSGPTSTAPPAVQKPMSYGQARFWFSHKYMQDKAASNVSVLYNIKGNVKVGALSAAVTRLGQRHEALRTRFFENRKQQAVQEIMPDGKLALEQVTVASESQAREELEKFENHHYDLNEGSTIRVRLLRMNESSNFLLIGYHHITMDGMSLQIFLTEMAKSYSGMALPDPPKQYQVFSERQRLMVENHELGQALGYWRQELSPLPEPLKVIRTSQPVSRKTLLQYKIERVHESVEPDINARVKRASRTAGVSPFHFYLSVFKVMLSKFLKVDDVCIGVSDANRIDGDSINTIGMFLNSLPIRITSKGDEPFPSLLKATKAKLYAAMANSSVPFDIVLRELAIPRSNTHSPLFQVFVDYRNEALAKQPFGNCYLDGVIGQGSKTACDIVLNIIDSPTGKVFFNFEMQQSLYSKDAALTISKAYVHLLKQLTRDHSTVPDKVSLFDTAEAETTLLAGRGTVQESTWQATLPQQISAVAASKMNLTALEDGHGTKLTYRQMMSRSNSIADALLKQNTPSGAKVACLLSPTCEWVCTLIAVLHIGAVYVPLDSRHPLSRLSDIVQDCGATTVVCDSGTLTLAQRLDAESLDVSTVKATRSMPPLRARSESSAIILYTSGSTGKPKGILYRHSNWIDGLLWKYQFGEQKVLQQSALSFDMSVDQVVSALCNGGSVYIASAAERKDPEALAKIMTDKDISFTIATPSEYSSWMSYGRRYMVTARSWQHAISGGEPLPEALLAGLKSIGATKLNLLNGYGPSEVTLACTAFRVPLDVDIKGPVPAGKVFPNYSVYILGDDLQPVPTGVPGEIVVSGAGVSCGYLGNAELTSAKFLPDPYASAEFVAKGWNTMYRTGDRGYLSTEGLLQIMGRMDDDTQVKLRGMRFELKDVEAALTQAGQGAFETVIVTSRGEPAAFLAAHVKLASPHRERSNTARQAALDDALKRVALPQHMIPAHIAELDSLPLTINGKVDRRAVANMSLTNTTPNTTDDKLTNVERKLKAIWQETLPDELSEVHDITPDTDFFAVGGNSLLLVRVQALIRERLSVALPLIEMFEISTLRKMAAQVESSIVVEGIDWDKETAVQDELLALNKARNEDISSVHPPAVMSPQPPTLLRRKTSTALWKKMSGSATRDKPATTTTSTSVGTNGIVVALTGATGFVGSRLLKELLADPRVSEIHCLAVRSTAAKRKRPIPASNKIFVNAGELSAPMLGLNARTADHLASRVDVVIHTGAKRSFWDNYDVIRDVNVASTKEIVKMFAGGNSPDTTTAGGKRTRIHYISSSEDSLEDFDKTRPTDGAEGYIASKWACEKYLHNVSDQLGLSTTTHRFGVNRVAASTSTSTANANANPPEQEDIVAAAPNEFIKSMAKYTLLSRHVPVADDWEATVRFMNADVLAKSIIRSALSFSPSSSPSSSSYSPASSSAATAATAVVSQIVTHRPDFTIDAGSLRDQLYERLGWKRKVLKMKEVNPMYWVGVLKYAGFEYVVCGQEIRMGQRARDGGLTEKVLLSRR